MIDIALNKLRNELQLYLTAARPVTLDNVALIESADKVTALGDHVIITLVNIEEESSLKNGLHYRRTPIGGIEYENPPVYLNLYLLFTANFPRNYDVSIMLLGRIIQFLQGQNSFIISSEEGESQLTLDLYTMTFEQINHLWGSLGGKQIPFVMYKARLVKISDRKSQGTGSPIIEIEGSVYPDLQ